MDESNPEDTSPAPATAPTVPALPAAPVYAPPAYAPPVYAPPAYAPPAAAVAPRPPKSPVLALVLSIVFPGIGQVYNGQYSKAVFILAAFVGSLYGAVQGAVFPFVFCIPFVLFFSYIDAWRSAAIINERAAGGTPLPAEESLESPLWGASLIAMGLVLLLNNLGWLRLSALAEYWPLALIVAGGVFLYKSLNRRRDDQAPPRDRDAFLS